MDGNLRRVAITGLGVVSPVGVGTEAFWDGLMEAKSGVDVIQSFDPKSLPSRMAGEINGFDAKKYVQQRKSLKVMSRQAQLAAAATQLALDDAQLPPDRRDPTRIGVSLGAGMINIELDEVGEAVAASTNGHQTFDLRKWGHDGMPHLFPLWMLKHLPNMTACHLSIFHDAQGPNNTILQGDASSNLAIGEAFSIVARGAADVMLAGGADWKIHPMSILRYCLMGLLSHRNDEPQRACRPYDAARDGTVLGEGAAVFVLEELEQAKRRGGRIYGEVVGFAANYCGGATVRLDVQGRGISRTMECALASARMNVDGVDFVSGNAAGYPQADLAESRAIHMTFGAHGSRLPVVSRKGNTSNLSAASGAVELAASLLSLQHNVLPPTLNCDETDPDCGLNVVAGRPRELGRHSRPRGFVANNVTLGGQSASLVVREFA